MILIFILIWLILVMLLGSWTGNEVGWVLSVIFHHPVHINTLLGIVLNLVSGGFAAPFDVIVTIIRSVVGG